MSPPLAERPHEDRPVRDESRTAGARLLHNPKLSGVLRAANVLISLTATGYFISFLEIAHTPVSWNYDAFAFFMQVLIITPQILPLLAILVIEATTVGTVRRHALIFVLATAMIALGRFWTTGVIAAINA